MEDYFKIHITECSYEDDWNEGEVRNTYQTVGIPIEKSFKSPQEALKYFYDNYGGEKFGIYRDDEDNDLKFFIEFTASNGRYGFEEATEDQMNEWKDGKITLYDVKYEMFIEKVSMVTELDTSSLEFEIKK